MPNQQIAVVGAGPAGLAAAVAAAEVGGTVQVLDDNMAPGGQIWRNSTTKRPPARLRKLLDRASISGVQFKNGLTIVDAPEPNRLDAVGETGLERIRFDKLILATGARELFLPFPGWTLPGVMGVGGAQALLKSGANFAGKRVVVAGSGPLLIAVAAAFAESGADLVGVFEQASLRSLSRFALRAFKVERVIEASKYFALLGSAPFQTSSWVVRATGSERLEEVSVTDGNRTWTEPCDLLACSYRLIPNTELACLIGCRITDGRVHVDEHQETTVAGVYAAGESVGIGGLDLALAEGEVAGKAAAGGDDSKSRLATVRLNGFRGVLERAFSLDPRLFGLASPETILCRCEDVRLGDIDPSWSAREAKLTSRIGMGPCQGRICGPAARHLFGWKEDRVRPPLYPTEVNQWVAPGRANKI